MLRKHCAQNGLQQQTVRNYIEETVPNLNVLKKSKYKPFLMDIMMTIRDTVSRCQLMITTKCTKVASTISRTFLSASVCALVRYQIVYSIDIRKYRLECWSVMIRSFIWFCRWCCSNPWSLPKKWKIVDNPPIDSIECVHGSFLTFEAVHHIMCRHCILLRIFCAGHSVINNILGNTSITDRDFSKICPKIPFNQLPLANRRKAGLMKSEMLPSTPSNSWCFRKNRRQLVLWRMPLNWHDMFGYGSEDAWKKPKKYRQHALEDSDFAIAPLSVTDLMVNSVMSASFCSITLAADSPIFLSETQWQCIHVKPNLENFKCFKNTFSNDTEQKV